MKWLIALYDADDDDDVGDDHDTDLHGGGSSG